MTKYYPPAPRKPKEKSLKPSSKMDTPSSASTPALWDSLKQCDSVSFTLCQGRNINAQIQGLEEDNGVIYGVTTDGLNFAIPYASVSYVMEVAA